MNFNKSLKAISTRNNLSTNNLMSYCFYLQTLLSPLQTHIFPLRGFRTQAARRRIDLRPCGDELLEDVAAFGSCQVERRLASEAAGAAGWGRRARSLWEKLLKRKVDFLCDFLGFSMIFLDLSPTAFDFIS